MVTSWALCRLPLCVGCHSLEPNPHRLLENAVAAWRCQNVLGVGAVVVAAVVVFSGVAGRTSMNVMFFFWNALNIFFIEW